MLSKQTQTVPGQQKQTRLGAIALKVIALKFKEQDEPRLICSLICATHRVAAVNGSILNVDEISIWDWLVSELVDGGVSSEVVVFGFDENGAGGGVVITSQLHYRNGIKKATLRFTVIWSTFFFGVGVL